MINKILHLIRHLIRKPLTERKTCHGYVNKYNNASSSENIKFQLLNSHEMHISVIT